MKVANEEVDGPGEVESLIPLMRLLPALGSRRDLLWTVYGKWE